MKQRAERMLNEVTAFLCHCGELPALKSDDEEMNQEEQQLEKALWGLFAPVVTHLLTELSKRKSIPSNEKEREQLLKRCFGQLAEDFSKLIVHRALGNAKRGRFQAFDDLEHAGVTISYSDFDRWTYDRLRDKFYTFSKDTTQRIIGDIGENLATSYRDGLGIDEAAEALQKEFAEIRDYRLRLIARTEINTAQNEGIQVTLEDLGVQYKQWLTARDTRVRGHKPEDKANHVKMHGEVVKLGERFSNGLYIPGDRTGEIVEWINCRCRIRPYIPKKGQILINTPFGT
jgi:hypothetical protein